MDRSGSMSGLESDTIGGFNATIEKQKKEPGEALISTVLFDDKSEVLYDRVNLEKIIDAIETARHYGIDEDRAANFVNDEMGIEVMCRAESAVISDIRKGRARNRNWKKEVEADYQKRR